MSKKSPLKRQRLSRSILAFFRMPGSWNFGLLLVIFIIILAAAVVDLRFNYINPDTDKALDLVGAIYIVLTLLFFETPAPLPDSWLTRVVFFVVPFAGILVLGQGLLRLGRTLFDKEAWNRAMASTYKDHTIVCGLGKISARVVRWILDMGEEAVVIEKNPANPFIEDVRRWGVPVMIADARRPEVLEEAAIQAAESIVPCTNDDLINLSIALEARRQAPGIKVVLRMFDVQMAENVRQGFGIHTAFSIPELAAPAFAAAATKAPLDYAFSISDECGLVTVTDFTLVNESPLVGYVVGKIETEFNVAVIAHRHGHNFQLHPTDDVVLAAGDRFVVSASIESLMQIAQLTPPTRNLDRYQQGRWPIKTSRD